MEKDWANDFYEILPTLSKRNDLVEISEELIKTENIPGKALEGVGRLEKFRDIMIDLIYQRISLQQAYLDVEKKLGYIGSPYAYNNRIFPTGWGERLVRTQLSRFYNQAILTQILNQGQEKCFIPHSNSEDSFSKCSLSLAGKEHNSKALLDAIVDIYSNGNFQNKSPRVPDHPHCTHVVRPID